MRRACRNNLRLLYAKSTTFIFFQQVRKIIAARQSFDEVWSRPPHSVPNPGNKAAPRTQEYCQRRQCAWNDWTMSLADLLQMEETKHRQMNPGVRDLTRHTHPRQILRVIRRRVENDAASDNPQLTRGKSRDSFRDIKVQGPGQMLPQLRPMEQ